MTDDFSRTSVVFHNTIDIWIRITQRKVSIIVFDMCFVCTARPFTTNMINVIFFFFLAPSRNDLRLTITQYTKNSTRSFRENDGYSKAQKYEVGII